MQFKLYHVVFVLTNCMQVIVEGLHKWGVWLHAHCCSNAKPKVCLLVSVFSVWGTVIIVLVNERVSINTLKASFSVSTSNQPSAEQLRERERQTEKERVREKEH